MTLIFPLQSQYGIPMHSGPLEGLEVSERFNIVVMNQVLEHVHEPILSLETVRYLLKPGGIMHVAVPNAAYWEARLAGWASYEPYHLIYFDPRTLERTVTSAGLTSRTLTTHNSFSGWFLPVLRALLRVNRGDRVVVAPHASRKARAKNPLSSLL